MKHHISIDAYTPNVGALDFSHLLDAPAGCHGYVQVKDGKLFYEDGTRARYIGFNFPGGGMMPEKESAELYAARLASLGVNVVRLHAGDSSFKGTFSVIDYAQGNSRHLDADNMDRLHYFVSKLKEKGIYVHVDLHCYRSFLSGDELDYPDPPAGPLKSITLFNRRIIELQKEFATNYLSAVNPYTGHSFLDDPCVMCIQITNENSVLFVNKAELLRPGREPYHTELKARFNAWLIEEYGDREGLRLAWTREGECALPDEEDPAEGTVNMVPFGDYIQPWIDPRAYWGDNISPARYADFVRFAAHVMRGTYLEMIEHVRSLGAKAPINCSNLLHGIADIWANNDADLCENNAYYNHPSPNSRATGFHWNENISRDPRLTTYPDFDRTRDNHLVLQLAGAAVKGKPFVVSEWNEYGGMPFHSPAFLMQAAYACLQDWDGLIVYAFSGSPNAKDNPADTITDVMRAFNDPSLIYTFGAMAEIFLKGLVRPAKYTIDMCYAAQDRWMLPPGYKTAYGFAPFISKVRTVFLPEGDVYDGDADIAISSGFTSSGDFTRAKHAVVHARSPYADAMQREYVGQAFLDKHRAKRDAKPCLRLGTLDAHSLVIDDTNAIEREADPTAFSRLLNRAMHDWHLLTEGQGLTDDPGFVSDTGEIDFAFGRNQFRVDAPSVKVFCGYPAGEEVSLGPVRLRVKNEKISLVLLPLDGKFISDSSHLLLIALGGTGNDGNDWAGDILLAYGGKLEMDCLEAEMRIEGAQIYPLDALGNRLGALHCVDGKMTVAPAEASPALEIVFG